MKILAIIPARGGSKGVLRKNIRPLAGKSLIYYSIDAARKSHYINRVVVSTDDAEIATLAELYGSEVVMRPTKISGDYASSESALLHTLEHLNSSEGYVPNLVVFLQCTSPLTIAQDIDGTVQALIDEQADSALSVTPFHYFLWRQDEHGNATGINHDKRGRPLRQEQEPQYRETGAVYVMNTEEFLQAEHRFIGKTAMYVTPLERCLEIDELVDFQVAEVLIRKRQWTQRVSLLPDPVAALVLDFDGVFTDNKVVVAQDGRELVVCDRSDGWGLSRLKEIGVPMLVLSAEKNPVVEARCSKLGITCQHGLDDKLGALNQWLTVHSMRRSHVVYVGNDVNDKLCLMAVGCPVVVADAHPDAVGLASIVLENRGGNGAIRELVDMIESRMLGG